MRSIYVWFASWLALNAASRCKKCKGSRTVTEKAKQDIYVERGMSDGQKIVLPGAGDQLVRFISKESFFRSYTYSRERHLEMSCSS